jgi:hypothetical protein
MLTELNSDKVCFLIAKLHEFGVETEVPVGNSSNASDDGFVAVYIDSPDQSVRREIEEFIGAMNDDEKRELIALSMIGSGEYQKEEWPELLKEASGHPEATTAAYLLGIPNAADQLEEGLSMFDLNCEGFDDSQFKNDV